MKSIYIALAVIIFLSNIAFAQSRSLYWISADLLEMHVDASSTSEIMHQWPLNTPLIKLEERGEWCKVTDINERLAGFVLCDQLITDKQKNMKVFWNHPSVESLITVARYIERQLTDEQTQDEYRFVSESYSLWVEEHDSTIETFEIPISRQANEEFNAMKASLLKGVKVNEDLSKSPYENGYYFQKLEKFDAQEIYEVGDYLDELLKRKILPRIKTSFFSSAQDVLFPAATNSVDDLSVVANSKLSAKVIKSAYGVIARGEPYIFSYWDIGKLEVTLVDPLAIYSVAKNGLVGKQTGKRFDTESGYGDCDFGMPLYLPNDLVAVDNYPAIKYPLVQFYTQKHIPPKVHVRTHSYQLRGDSPEKDSIKVHLNTVDLNADNVADIAVTESAIPAYESEAKTWVTYFINLNGEWYFAFNFVVPECT
ncbi:hypothetical protein [Cellvibrio sp. OA-2007]|uniref:hypothetical protein n=1 Tax=Cellvibrio sp. OA-2007 TaxID=529823 RepID=UPI0007835E21|nr:hypothetical protein [Cellvibrio sp. OA-2007]